MSEADEQLKQELKELCGSCFSFSPQLLPDELPLRRLDMDSLHLLEFAVAAERRFGVRLDERDLIGCAEVGDMAQRLILLIRAAQANPQGETVNEKECQ